MENHKTEQVPGIGSRHLFDPGGISPFNMPRLQLNWE